MKRQKLGVILWVVVLAHTLVGKMEKIHREGKSIWFFFVRKIRVIWTLQDGNLENSKQPVSRGRSLNSSLSDSSNKITQYYSADVWNIYYIFNYFKTKKSKRKTKNGNLDFRYS